MAHHQNAFSFLSLSKDLKGTPHARTEPSPMIGHVLLTLVVLGTGCTTGSTVASSNQGVSLATVVFHVGQREVVVLAEVVADPATRAQGLMNRSHLPEQRGMLFVFPTEENQTFWMKNTLIPLDMIFVDSARKVVGMVENAEPLTLESRGIGRPSRYVVEVNGGFVRAQGITAGIPVTFENVKLEGF